MIYYWLLSSSNIFIDASYFSLSETGFPFLILVRVRAIVSTVAQDDLRALRFVFTVLRNSTIRTRRVGHEQEVHEASQWHGDLHKYMCSDLRTPLQTYIRCRKFHPRLITF